MATNSLNTIDQFIQQVSGAEKTAAEAHTEPGSIGGETSHPVKDVDDRTSEATEGERSSENSKDVKEDQGEPAVDNAPEAQAKVAMNEGTAADDQLQIGTNKQPTGEDPTNETQSAKPGKEDGGHEGPSSHPARTDNDDIDGHKYAKDIASMSMQEKAAALTELGNEICSEVAVSADHRTNKQAENQTQAVNNQNTDDANQVKAATEKLASQIGWEMAGILAGSMDKKAADAMVQNALEDVVKSAHADADNVAAYLKLAMENEEGGEEALPKSEAGGEEAYPEAPEAAGDPAGLGAMGGPAPEAGGDDMAELAAVLEELGVTPDELLAMIAGEGEAGAPPAPEAGLEAAPDPAMEAAGAPAPPMGPEAGGMMPPVDPAAAGMEVAASDKGGQLTADKTASYIKEVVQRARAKRAEAAK